MLNYIAIVIFLIFSAFFSATEIAFASANEVRLRQAAEKKKTLSARLALDTYNHYEDALATILIGNNLVNIGSSSVATVIVVSLLGESHAWVATLAMTILVLIFGEITPKIIAKAIPETFATVIAIPIYVCRVITKPIVIVIQAIIKLVSLLWKNKVDTSPTVTEDELETIIETIEDEGVIDEDKCELIQSAFGFDDVQAYEIITPRVDLLAINIDSPREDMIEKIVTSTYSRIPVYRDTIDNIIGILHVNRVLKELTENSDANILELLLPPVYVHKTMALDNVLNKMQKEKCHMTIVTDEYGGVMGVLTMEDVLEQLVGDIWDESDEIEPEITELSDNVYEVDGDMRIEDFFDEIDFDDRNFDDDNATVGGFVVELLDRYAHKNDVVTYENLTFTVTKVKKRRILKLKVEVEEISDETEDE